MSEHRWQPLPLLIDGARGALQAFYYPPQGVPHPAGDLLVVPAFAEEMNRCRAMVAMQARALSTVGIGTLVLDPYGTGDSAGDFVDARWDGWLDDLARGLAWLRLHGQGCRSLWALRLGAVMASQLAVADGAIERLLLWQPVFDGKQFFTQFLRIRIAAEMNRLDRVKTTGELRERCAAGESIEVSGYRIGPGLASDLDVAAFDPRVWDAPTQCDWFETVQTEEAVPSPLAQQAAQRYAGVRLDAVRGPAFWHVHERELAPALIEATTRRLREWVGPGARRPPIPAAAAEAPEQPIVFDCGGDPLAGVLHRAAPSATRGVVIVVAGGPQYRVGAHRQFVTLARRLVADGLPVLRFDLRGMGDSCGTHRGYLHSDPDIRAAVDALLQQLPSLREVVLLGECESASGILFYAWRDPRIAKAVLINPWVRTHEGQAQVIVRHYYLDRLRSPEFWKKLGSGQFRAGESLRSLVNVVRAFVRGRIQMARHAARPEVDDLASLPLPVRVAEGMRRFGGRSLLLMSGADYIAREFDEVTAASRAWDGLLQREHVRRVDIDGADHTFSRDIWKNAAADAIASWLRQR